MIRDLTALEWLKVDLLAAVGDLFRGLLRGTHDLALDALAHIVLVCYVVARRLGYGYARLDLQVEEQVRAHLQAGHVVEQHHGDLTLLLSHFRTARRQAGASKKEDPWDEGHPGTGCERARQKG